MDSNRFTPPPGWTWDGVRLTCDGCGACAFSSEFEPDMGLADVPRSGGDDDERIACCRGCGAEFTRLKRAPLWYGFLARTNGH